MGCKIPCRGAAPYSLRLRLYTGAFGAEVNREWNCECAATDGRSYFNSLSSLNLDWKLSCIRKRDRVDLSPFPCICQCRADLDIGFRHQRNASYRIKWS